MARSLLMAEVSGGRVRGRPRLGWMDGVKVALGNRALLHMDLNEFYEAIFGWPCVPSDRPPVFRWLSPGEGWDAVTSQLKIKAVDR